MGEPVRKVEVQDADGVVWSSEVEWRPRFLGLVRKIGGWRDKKKHPEPHAADTVDAGSAGVDLAGWAFEPGRRGDTGQRPTAESSGSPGLDADTGGGGWLDGVDDGVAVVLAVVVVLAGAILAFAAFWWVVLPALLIVLDVLLVIVLLLVGTVARVLLRRPWTVTARSARGDRLSKKVVGYRNAVRARDDVVDALRNGAVRHATS